MKKNIDVKYYNTKIGELVIGSYDEKLCILDFRYRRMRKTVDNRIKKHLKTDFVEQENEIIKETKKQIDEYLQGSRKEFDIPLLLLVLLYDFKILPIVFPFDNIGQYLFVVYGA